MYLVVLTFTAAALVSVHLNSLVNAEIESKINFLDNSLNPEEQIQPKKTNKRTFVRISDPPPVEIQTESSRPLELSCGVMGTPAPSVAWYKNGELIDNYEETDEIARIDPSSLVTVVSSLVVLTPSNGDVYTCVANSGIKKDKASTTVFVSEEQSNFLQNLLAVHKPKITYFYSDILQNMNTNLMLPCHIDPYSKGQVYWVDNEDNVIFGDYRRKVLPSGDLMIKGLRWSDMGEYKCIVKNYYGTDSSTTFLYPVKV